MSISSLFLLLNLFSEPSALGLLALIRMMIKYDFDVEVYLQEVYWKKNIRFGVDSLHVRLQLILRIRFFRFYSTRRSLFPSRPMSTTTTTISK